MNKLIVILLLGVSLIGNGCVSHAVHKNWVKAKQAQAVRVEANGEQVLVGIDVTAGEYLRDNWGVAIAAGLADAALIYGGYRAVTAISDELTGDSNDSFGDNNAPGRDDNDNSNISIVVNQ